MGTNIIGEVYMSKLTRRVYRSYRTGSDLFLFGVGVLMLSFMISHRFYTIWESCLLSISVTLLCVNFPCWNFLLSERVEEEEVGS